MLLAIDVGNTNTVLGLFLEGRLQHTWRVSTHPICTSDEFRAKLHTLLSIENLRADVYSSVVISSVVPPFSAMLRTAFKGTSHHFIDWQSPFSFSIQASPPAGVGADRLVNAEAAIRDYGAPCIIVDSGTATTLCAINRNREYLGGAIMPGIELSIEALARNTAKLFTVELTPPSKSIGSNTTEALKSGLLLGYASMIDGMVCRFREELGEPQAKVIATGGISQLLKGMTKELEHFDPSLTLKGIAYLHETISSR